MAHGFTQCSLSWWARLWEHMLRAVTEDLGREAEVLELSSRALGLWSSASVSQVPCPTPPAAPPSGPSIQTYKPVQGIYIQNVAVIDGD